MRPTSERQTVLSNFSRHIMRLPTRPTVKDNRIIPLSCPLDSFILEYLRVNDEACLRCRSLDGSSPNDRLCNP